MLLIYVLSSLSFLVPSNMVYQQMINSFLPQITLLLHQNLLALLYPPQSLIYLLLLYLYVLHLTHVNTLILLILILYIQILMIPEMNQISLLFMIMNLILCTLILYSNENLNILNLCISLCFRALISLVNLFRFILTVIHRFLYFVMIPTLLLLTYLSRNLNPYILTLLHLDLLIHLFNIYLTSFISYC